jgi:hypothetical protein
MDKNADAVSEPEDDLPDVSDLKTYDVPDPPVPSGGCGMGLLLMPVGILVAVMFLKSVAMDHYFAIIENPQEFEWNRGAAVRYASQLPPEGVLERVLAIKDESLRGAFHKALSSTKDAKHIPAILAYARKEKRDIQAVGKSLVAFGEAGTQPLKEALHSKDREEVKLAANALVGVNLKFVTGYCSEKIEDYQKMVPGEHGLYWASKVQSTVERGSQFVAQAQITSQDIAQASAVRAKGKALGFLIMEMLKSMAGVGESKDVDFCFIHGLSNFNAQVAEFCANTLKQRLSTNDLIDTLFSYIAAKDSFSQREVDIFEGLLLEKGTQGATRVAYNLDRLLKEAKGEPEGVFFLYKKMGFRVLRDKGTKACLETLEAYANDTRTYIVMETRNGVKSESEVAFKNEVAAAIRQIKNRRR